MNTNLRGANPAMRSIWKFPIEVTGVQVIEMPRGATILSAQFQDGVLCLWAAVHTAAEKEPRAIAIYGTGHPVMEQAGVFIGTVQQGPFVWHLFDETVR